MRTAKKKQVDEQETGCVWFPDLECPIRTMILNKNKVNAIVKPNDESGSLFAGMGQMMAQVIPMDLMVLPAYCNVCHLRQKRLGDRSS